MSHQHIFIGGLHRSGTSLLAAILRQHPQVSGFHNTGVNEDEGQFLQSVYPVALTYGGPGRFGFHPAAHVTEASPFVTAANAATLFGEWSRYWDLSKPYLLEKSPPNLLKSRFLQALFPNAYFIMIVRHPLAVTYATQKWRPRLALWFLLRHWLVCHEQFAGDQRALRKVQIVYYEQLMAAPQTTLQRLYAFLGLDEGALAPQQIRSGLNEGYFARWVALGRQPGNRLYRTAMIAAFERRVKRFGYSLRPNQMGDIHFAGSMPREYVPTALDATGKLCNLSAPPSGA